MTVKVAYLLTLKNALKRETLHKFTTVSKKVTILAYKMVTSQAFEFIEIASYVALISDGSSEPVHFVKAEAKGTCEEIMTMVTR